jgi:hypothetical protein
LLNQNEERKMETTVKAKFDLGMIVTTPGAFLALKKARESALGFLMRHEAGDWGEIPPEDWEENEFSLNTELRLISAYRLRNGTRLWIITEADRSLTTILLPEEY